MIFAILKKNHNKLVRITSDKELFSNFLIKILLLLLLLYIVWYPALVFEKN